MNFRPELAAAVMAGTKTVTRRVTSENPRSPWSAERCGVRVGQSVAVCPGRGKHNIGRAIVTSVDLLPCHTAEGLEVVAEGFKSRQAFQATFEALNGGYDPAALAWRIGLKSERQGWHVIGSEVRVNMLAVPKALEEFGRVPLTIQAMLVDRLDDAWAIRPVGGWMADAVLRVPELAITDAPKRVA